MRRAIAVLVLALPALLDAQATRRFGPVTRTTDSTTTVTTGAPAAPPTAAPLSDSLRRRLERVSRDPAVGTLPGADAFTSGPRTVAASEHLAGTVAVMSGPLDVFGTVDGDAIAIDGDVTVHPGAHVAGNVVAVGGKATVTGGDVGGDVRVVTGAVGAPRALAARPAPLTGFAATRQALGLTVGWLAVMLGIGIAAFMFAGGYLETVVETVERRFARSLVAGLIGQVALLPALLLLCVGLAITLLGILLIPFAVVAFVMAAAGIVTLGFLAIAQLTGQSLSRRGMDTLSARGAALKALMTGIVAYVALWVLAACFAWSPVVALALRGLAFALTWMATTVGFGAAILSRAGTRRVEGDVEREPVAASTARPAVPAAAAWQTPTPITGVVAARRPTPAPRTADVER